MKKLLVLFVLLFPTIAVAGTNYDDLLREAVGKCDLQGISYSLKKGAKVDSTIIGEVFTGRADVNECGDTFTALLGGGLDPNVRLPDGATPAIKVFSNYFVDKEIVDIFAKAGARATDKISKVKGRPQWGIPGWTPLMLLVNANGGEINRVINVPGAYLGEKIEGNWNWVLAHSQVNAQNPDGNTALHLAADRNFEKIVKTLIQAGANKKLKNRAGYTAADVAVKSGYSGLLAYLD